VKGISGNDDPERGVTLVEMLVSMTIFAIVIGLALAAVVDFQRRANDVAARTDSSAQVRIALEQISLQVRSGNVLYSPVNEVGSGAQPCSNDGSSAGTCMRIYTQANGPERCVQWRLVSDPARAGTKLLRNWSGGLGCG